MTVRDGSVWSMTMKPIILLRQSTLKSLGGNGSSLTYLADYICSDDIWSPLVYEVAENTFKSSGLVYRLEQSEV